ncbi:hypothetical protein PsorP6_010517 [Peronosclerospora sorghi]|uniref:Uncharacterized protein n=1 Tax=Peronosclerospora sorghi TaxID=230839 RepID=A0ACC0VWC0_9STRA|nr:hypothetical protein PsorP6_010517 [Peronosclerospora sorghi]
MAGTSEAIPAPFEVRTGHSKRFRSLLEPHDACVCEWLVGDPMLPVSCVMTDTVPAIGRIVVRFEADVTASTVDLFSNGLERITRPFMYIGVPTEAQGDESVEGHLRRTVRLTRAPRERRETKADAPNERSQAI